MTTPIGNASATVLALARDLSQTLDGTPYRADVDAIGQRLNGPLHVAIAGRVKAGKSTLLNALVGERLAPTDAGECTRLVSWYRRGQRYEVSARLRTGQDKALEFRRDDGALNVVLNGVAESDVQFLDVRWPASTLERVTLIDTPGLASLNDENSRRTREFLDHDGDHTPDADAVIYLMRHLHRSDVEFLDAFMDRSVAAASPVNAVAVLSRGDEIGAGRPDAMESAGRIAERYRSDESVHALCATVVPMAGLLAETGLTLREAEVSSLRELAATPAEELELMLLSAEQFCDVHASGLTAEIRRELLDRLGMYGVRIAVREIRAGATTAVALGPKLVEHSGLNRLNRVIAEHFLPRARVLQARSALVAIRSLARRLRASDPARGNLVDREAERIEAGAVDFVRIRAAHMLASGGARVSDADRAELERILLAATAEGALGLQGGATPQDLAAGALQLIARWRDRASNPLADPGIVEVCEAAARTGEAIYGAAQAPGRRS
ncbi:MAG TPA: dynamin family protein [Acidimicrobiales bacterium]